LKFLAAYSKDDIPPDYIKEMMAEVPGSVLDESPVKKKHIKLGDLKWSLDPVLLGVGGGGGAVASKTAMWGPWPSKLSAEELRRTSGSGCLWVVYTWSAWESSKIQRGVGILLALNKKQKFDYFIIFFS
jgi:hypothetical protein